MKRSQKFLLSLIIIVGITYFIAQTLIKAGVFSSVSSVSDYHETTIKAYPGVEDITIDSESNRAYLSAQDRRNPKSTGAIFSMNLSDSSKKLVNLTEKFKLNEFRPHGISFLSIQGKKFLFVISHKDAKNDILKFEILGDTLNYISKYSSTDFVSPNDILAVSENQFFITNDHGTRSKWQILFSDFLRIPSGNVVFYDGKLSKIVSEKLIYPNGIALSADGKSIYVASTLEKGIYVFAPQTQTNYLEQKDFVGTLYPPDNIEMTKNGDLIIGCHPKLFAFMSHRKNAENKSPSAVIELDHNDLQNQKLLYLNDGSTLSGSSVAAPFFSKNKQQNLLIGSVFEPKIIFLQKN
jgi:arylesterase/paraoxonase